jgi:hypothetical protein
MAGQAAHCRIWLCIRIKGIQRSGGTGNQLGSTPSPDEIERESFANESVKAWTAASSVTERILGYGHTDIAIQPGPFDPRRLPAAKLESFVTEHTVRLRGGRPMPYVDNRQPVQRHGAWIGQDVLPQVVPHIEAWRLCTSGQFLHRRVLATDLRDAQELTGTNPSAGAVAVWDVLLYLVEVAEFEARMATSFDCERITSTSR